MNPLNANSMPPSSAAAVVRRSRRSSQYIPPNAAAYDARNSTLNAIWSGRIL